jgi:hypothetical protein
MVIDDHSQVALNDVYALITAISHGVVDDSVTVGIIYVNTLITGAIDCVIDEGVVGADL